MSSIRRILLVQRDLEALMTLAQRLDTAGYQTLVATDTVGVLMVLERDYPQVALIHEDLGENALRSLLFHIKRKRPELPIVVIRDQNDPASLWGFPVWTPPHTPDRLHSLLRKMSRPWTLIGRLSDVEWRFDDLLETLQLEGKSGILELQGKRWWGWIFFQNGEVADALYRNRGGMAALTEIYRRVKTQPDPVQFLFHEAQEPLNTPRRIRVPLDILLVNLQRTVDEQSS